MPAEGGPDTPIKHNGSSRGQKRKQRDREDSPQRERGGHFRRPAEELDKWARALRSTGDQVDGALSAPITRMAAGIENAAHHLRDATPQDVIHAMEAFARRRPMAFLGLAALVGFGGARLLKGSSKSSRATP